MSSLLQWLAASSTASLALSMQPASAAPSACIGYMRESDGMLKVMHGVGLNAQMARRCNVPEADIRNKMSTDMDRFRPCIVETKITAPEIDTAMAAGARDADATYAQSGNKALICESVRDQFAQ